MALEKWFSVILGLEEDGAEQKRKIVSIMRRMVSQSEGSLQDGEQTRNQCRNAGEDHNYPAEPRTSPTVLILISLHDRCVISLQGSHIGASRTY